MILDADTNLQLERTLQVPADVIWRCWTRPEHLQHFFVPKPHKLVSCDIDLHPGGRFNTVFEVEGNEMRNEGVFLELIPCRKLVFTDT